MKKIVALVLALCLLFTLCACSGQPAASEPAGPAESASAPAESASAPAESASAPAESAGAKGIYGSADETYYFNVFVNGVEYWFPVYAAFKDTGRILGVNTVYGGTPEYDASLQVESFDQMLAQNPTGIYLSPINAEPFVEPIARAAAQGVPVVTFASDSPDSARVGYVTSDNVKEGTAAADALAAAVNEQGAALTVVNPGQTNHDLRTDTFQAVIKEKYPNIRFIGEVTGNQDMDAAQQGVTAIAQQNPDLNIIFTPEATTGQGAVTAVKALGMDVKVMCCDVNEAVLDMIKSGDFYGSINPNQGAQGYWGMMVLFSACHPELFDFMSYREDSGLNPIYVPYLDNGLDVVTADIADYYYMDKFVAKKGYKDLADMLSPGGPAYD